jgi:hypothetical protein
MSEANWTALRYSRRAPEKSGFFVNSVEKTAQAMCLRYSHRIPEKLKTASEQYERVCKWKWKPS